MSVNRSKVQQDADRLARLGKVDDAISLYQQLLQSSPRDMNIKSRIGELHFRAGFITGAVKILSEVAEFYEQEGFQAKSVAVRKRISEIGPAAAEGEGGRSATASKRRAKAGAVLPFLDPAAEPGRARSPQALPEPRPAAAAPATVVEVVAAPDPLVARAAETTERFRKVDVEHKRVQERLGVIEEKKAATVAVVFEKVRRDAQVKLGALNQVREACGREVTAVRDAVVAELRRIRERIGSLETDLEEVRFLKNIGDFTAEEFNRGEAAKLGEMATVRRRLGILTGVAAELDAVIGERAAAEAALAVEAAPREAAPAAQPLPVVPAELPRPAAAPFPVVPGELPRPAVAAPLPVVPAELPRPAVAAPLPVVPAELPRPAAAAPFPAAPAELPRPAATAPLPVPFPELASEAPPAPKVPRPVFVVRWQGARLREEVLYLATGLSIMGRGSESEILLLEKSISRRHASLRLENGEAHLTDLESGNGTFVNGERLLAVDPHKLNDGDVVRLGELEMVYWSMRPRSDE